MKKILSVLILFVVSISSVAYDRIDVDGASLEYEIKGSGEVTVLFDAGAVSGMASWDSIWKELPSDITAIRFSRRGEGGSSSCKGQLTKSDYAKDVSVFLKAIGIQDPVVYVSHSLGGIIAREFAAHNSDSVKAMLFIDPSNPRDVEIVSKVDPVNGPLEIKSTKKKDYSSGDWCFLDVIWDKSPAIGYREIGDIPITLIAGVKKVKQPANIFDTDEARKLWGEYQAEWVEQFPQGVAVMASESGHFVQNDQPDIVLQELKRLIRRYKGANKQEQSGR